MARSVKIEWRGGQVKAATREAAARGLLLGAEHVLGESRKVVPLEEGTLQRSGVASIDDGELRAAVSYDTPYAVVQHEDMTLHHDAGRTAKYLERPLTAEADTVAEIVARTVRGELGT